VGAGKGGVNLLRYLEFYVEIYSFWCILTSDTSKMEILKVCRFCQPSMVLKLQTFVIMYVRHITKSIAEAINVA